MKLTLSMKMETLPNKFSGEETDFHEVHCFPCFQELGLIRMKQRAKRPKSAIMKPKSQLLFIVHIQGAHGGNVKWHALRLDTGNYSWGSEAVTRKTRILDVVYNTSNNELVRTQTLVKSAIVQNKTAAALAKKEGEEGEAAASPAEEAKKSNHLQRKMEKHQKDHKLDAQIEEQFGGGCLLSCISSRPGQCVCADGYILEGKELEFYMKKIHRKKGKGAAA
ncbi:hypothetical protein EZV62_013804 [Acer yangbiense]|uniref:40S ribosomal protein S8 n=1 Tax=Acer yangbiense TaxID=1000413 RepID=A0A5C7HQB0_9ROSI|nr:hypothetical protein EZV62_013804 [Acer yangbiense]